MLQPRQLRTRRILPPKRLQNQLVMDRRSHDLMAGGHLHGCPDFVRSRLGPRPGWVDRTNLHVHPGGALTATRAITDTGRMLWLVQGPGDTAAYLAFSPDPDDAFAQAAAAHRLKHHIAARWPEVTALRRRILTGQARVTLTGADLRLAKAPFWLTRLSARSPDTAAPLVLALMSFVDRTLAYPLFAAHLRG